MDNVKTEELLKVIMIKIIDGILKIFKEWQKIDIMYQIVIPALVLIVSLAFSIFLSIFGIMIYSCIRIFYHSDMLVMFKENLEHDIEIIKNNNDEEI